MMNSKYKSLFFIPVFTLMVTGCSQNNGLSLTSSVTTADVSGVTTIPFPYFEKTGGEGWELNRVGKSIYIVQVMNDDKVVDKFPVNASSSERAKETIILGGHTYTIVKIDVSTDNVSGFVTLKQLG